MALGWRGQYLRYRDFFLNVLELYKKKADLRAFLEIILSLSTISIFLVFALKPTALTIISLLQQVKEKQATVAALTQKISDLETAANVLSQNQSFLPDIDVSVTTGASPDVISGQILGLAAKNSISVLGISIGEVTIFGTNPTQKRISDFKPLPPGADEMPISISLRGDYQGLSGFIKDFENLRAITKLDVLSINSSTTEAGQVIVAILSGRVPFVSN